MRERVETTRERPKFVNSPRMCVCTRVHVGCIVDVLSLHTPTQPAHYVHRFSLPRRAVPHRVLLSPVPYAAPRAFPHPSLSTTLEIHLVVCLSARLAPPRLATPRFFLFLALCRNLSSPRRSRSRCNERCTLLSSCSRRRCFYSAAQSVSARLPARFVRRFASAEYPSLTRDPREIEERNLLRLTLL